MNVFYYLQMASLKAPLDDSTFVASGQHAPTFGITAGNASNVPDTASALLIGPQTPTYSMYGQYANGEGPTPITATSFLPAQYPTYGIKAQYA